MKRSTIPSERINIRKNEASETPKRNHAAWPDTRDSDCSKRNGVRRGLLSVDLAFGLEVLDLGFDRGDQLIETVALQCRGVL